MSKEFIKLNDYPQVSGVYWFINNDEVVYVGSSKDLHQRMTEHKSCIKKGSDHGYKQDFYQFLQSNSFTIEFQISDNYKQLEQELIEIHQPIFNANRAFTGLGAKIGREAEYNKEYYEEYKEEIIEHQKQYNKKYDNQLCNYNGETLTLNALKCRFRYRGIEHPVLEAKKFLIAVSAGDSNE